MMFSCTVFEKIFCPIISYTHTSAGSLRSIFISLLLAYMLLFEVVWSLMDESLHTALKSKFLISQVPATDEVDRYLNAKCMFSVINCVGIAMFPELIYAQLSPEAIVGMDNCVQLAKLGLPCS